MNPKAKRNAILGQAQRLANSGRFAEAVNQLELLRRTDPDLAAKDPDLQHTAGLCLMNLGQIPAAETCFTLALGADPARTAARVDFATLLRRDARPDEALAQLDEALARDPTSDLAARSKAALLMDLARYEDAGAILAPLAERYEGSPPTDQGPALVFARYALAADADHDRALALLDRALTAPGLPPMAARIVHRRRGELLDRLARYDEAFAAFSESHAQANEPWDPDAFGRRIDELIRVWTPDAAWNMPKPKPEAEPGTEPVEGRPAFVFIVGMPRSGTSLVEQILASVPGVFAGGERHEIRQIIERIDKAPPPQPGHPPQRALPMHPEWLRESNLADAARWYTERLDAARRIARCDEPTHTTDKMPYNFFYLPLIAGLFPGSKIIRCTRDPLDTCLSNYFQTFAGSHPHIHDLAHLGRFHRDHDRLMEHWLTIAPDLGLEIAEANYESLIADPEPEARRLVAFAGLGWTDDCLRFHANARAARTASNDQVRKPLYATSVRRHEHYAAHLGPLVAALKA